MKTSYWLGILIILAIVSCTKKNRWDIELPQEKLELKFTDISKDFFNQKLPLSTLQGKYPFFFDNSVSDEVWEMQRKDTLEKIVFDTVQKVFKKEDYKEEIERIFAHYNFYYPNELLPQVYTYSSGLQNMYEPILYGRKEGMLFVALDGFLGSDNELYKSEKVYPYMAKNMNPENIPSAVVDAIGREIIPFNPRQQTFVDLMVDEGKKQILKDALIPGISDELKIGYTQKQLEWAQQNEGNVWNYFVEQNMVFDTDKSYKERFIKPSPFSKFLNEIETDSPGRIGSYIGWQICKKYLEENSKISLQDFLNTDTQTIFKESKYKPEKGEGDYLLADKNSKDELKKYE